MRGEEPTYTHCANDELSPVQIQSSQIARALLAEQQPADSIGPETKQADSRRCLSVNLELEMNFSLF